MSRVTIACLLAAAWAACLTATAAAYDWQYVGMDGVAATCIEDDHDHDRVLVGTAEGFRAYDLVSGQWTAFEDEGWIGRTVHAVAADPLDADIILTGRVNAFFKGYLERSVDGGAGGDVVHQSQGGPFVDFARDWDRWYACNISDIAAGELVWSADGAAPWTPLTGHGQWALTAVAVGNAGDLLVAGNAGAAVSYDQGATWQPAGDGLGGAALFFLDTYLESGDVIATAAVGGGPAGVFRYDDPGTWTQVLSGESCRNVAVMWAPMPWPWNVVNRFAAVTGDGRVLVSEGTGAGAAWVDETGDLPAPAVDVAFTAGTRDLYVCTIDGGVYRYHPIVSEVGDTPDAAAAGLAASPNPFNPRTVLSFTLDAPGHAVLAVYDLAGRRVAVVHDGALAAGRHDLPWRAADLASGVYVARLTTAAGAVSTTVTLVK
jgi:hypothetical protein